MAPDDLWPFARIAALARGQILRLQATSSQTATTEFGDVDLVDAALTVPEGGDRGTVNAAGEERVRLQPRAGVTVEIDNASVVRLQLPTLSWAAVQLQVEPK